MLTMKDLFKRQVNGFTLAEVELPNGKGSHGHQMCVMQVVDALLYAKTSPSSASDQPAGVSEEIRGLAISMNDSLPEGLRPRLKEYVPAIAATKVSGDDGSRTAAFNAVLVAEGYGREEFGTAANEKPLVLFRALDAALRA